MCVETDKPSQSHTQIYRYRYILDFNFSPYNLEVYLFANYPEYAAKLHWIGSLFIWNILDFIWNIVGLLDISFCFLSNPVHSRNKNLKYDLLLLFFFSIVTRIFIYSFCISELQLIGHIFCLPSESVLQVCISD